MADPDGDDFFDGVDVEDTESESLPPPRPTYESDSYLSLDTIKDHLRVQRSDPKKDDQLLRLAQSAYAWAISFLNSPLHNLDDNSPPTSPLVLPADLETALLLHIEAFYSRDPQQMAMLISAAENLAYPYRINIGV